MQAHTHAQMHMPTQNHALKSACVHTQLCTLETQTDRHTHTHTHRQTDRQTDKQTDGQSDNVLDLEPLQRNEIRCSDLGCMVKAKNEYEHGRVETRHRGEGRGDRAHMTSSTSPMRLNKTPGLSVFSARWVLKTLALAISMYCQ